jgi:hypothetical protein
MWFEQAAGPQAAVDAPVVLLVEKHDSLRQLLDELLTEAGYRVLEAGSRRALQGQLREATRVDVIVTDTGLRLPGWEVVQEATGAWPGVPVYGEDPSTMTLVTKPFVITELLDVLDRLVPTRRPWRTRWIR